MKRVIRWILRVPLVAKLIGANVIIVASAIGLNQSEVTTAVIALTAASVVNFLLVRLALHPVDKLEELAERVSAGEFTARAVSFPYADKELVRLGDTVNTLLDSLAAERKRIQDLGAEVVRAHDDERANISRELHDSIAQTLAAVRFQISAASRETDAAEMRNRLAAANGMISAAMEEVVAVSYTLHSRVAEDLGLEAALETLGRQIEARSGTEVEICVSPSASTLSPAMSATLFRVAEETLRELEMHEGGKSATVEVRENDGLVRLEVSYESETLFMPNKRAGLALMKDRVLLAGGAMTIENRNGGTRVIAELSRMKAAS
jgi:signal transduction histidine kinase